MKNYCLHTRECIIQVNDYKLTERGIAGLKNLGNTVCYTQLCLSCAVFSVDELVI